MSQPTAPTETVQENPVGTQEVSVGESAVPTPTALEAAKSQNMHEAALRGQLNADQEKQLKEAVQQAIQDEFAITKAWQPKQIVKFVIDCPSGQKALVKHLDAMDLLQYDLLEELDLFTKMLFPTEFDAQGNPKERTEDEVSQNIWSVLRDPKKLQQFLDMTGRLIAAASVRPKVIHDGVALVEDENGEQRAVFGYQIESVDEQIKHFEKPIPPLKEGQCYSGAIDFADRMAFYTELNKPLELIKPFREQQNAMLASMESSEGIKDQAE